MAADLTFAIALGPDGYVTDPEGISYNDALNYVAGVALVFGEITDAEIDGLGRELELSRVMGRRERDGSLPPRTEALLDVASLIQDYHEAGQIFLSESSATYIENLAVEYSGYLEVQEDLREAQEEAFIASPADDEAAQEALLEAIDAQSDVSDELQASATEAYEQTEGATRARASEAEPEKIRLAQQAVLLSIMDQLAEKNKPLGYDPKMILVDGEPDFLVNNLTKRPGEKAFTNICPEQIAELTPYVRIYKVIGTERYEEKHVEYSFDQGLTATEVDALGSMSYGRGRGGGLKSIDWAYDGSDPFTASRSIQVNLNFFFQSLDELLRERFDPSTGESYKYIDLILQSPGCRQDRKEDDENAPEDQPKTAYSRYIEEYNPECFEIKLDLGWSDPGPNSYNTLGDIPTDRKLTTEAIEAQRTSLFLTFKDHELNIQQDGTVTLQANYQGRIAGLMTDPRANVFLDPKNTEITDSIKELEDLLSATNKKASNKESELTDKEKEALKKDKETINEQLKLKLQNQRQSLVASIVRELYDNNYLVTIEVDTSSYARYIDSIANGSLVSEGLVEDIEYKVFKLDGPSQEELDDLLAVLEEVPVGTDGRPPTEDELGEAYRQQGIIAYGAYKLIKYFGGYDNVETAPTLEETIDSETKENFYAEHVEFNYFYLGDLVDIITRRVLDPAVWGDSDVKGWRGTEYDNAVEKIRIVLGTVELKFAGKDGFTTVNLADIPISLALFLDWMKNNVIDSDRKEYPFIRFLQDIMKSLVSAAFGSTVFESALAQRPTVQKTFFSSAANNGIEPFVANGGVPTPNTPQEQLQMLQDQQELAMTEEILGNTDYADTSGTSIGISEQDLFIYGRDGELRLPRKIYPATSTSQYLTLGNKKDVGHYHYIMFFMDNALTRSKLNGDEAEDEANGLYHFRLGEKCGLLKQASFKKTNVQFFREARFAQQIGSNNPLAQLSNVYDVDITMIGNNIYIPGRRIYFDPRSISSLIGAPYEVGSPANLLGIGGYHIVTDVKSYIQDGKFETEISCTWETGGGDTANIRDPDDETGGDPAAAEDEASGS